MTTRKLTLGLLTVIMMLTTFVVLFFVVSCSGGREIPPCPIATMDDNSLPYPVPAILNERSPAGTAPPVVEGHVELGPANSTGSNLQSGKFTLMEGETIDVVVSSTKQHVYYAKSPEESVHFYLDGPARSYYAPENHIWDWGKRLYENVTTNSNGTGVQVKTAVRLIAWDSAVYEIEFVNYTSEPAMIDYGIYSVGQVKDFMKYIHWLDEMEKLGMWK